MFPTQMSGTIPLKTGIKIKVISQIPLLDNDICERHFCRSQNKKARLYRVFLRLNYHQVTCFARRY